MIAPAAPARTTVRGFATPATSGDEDSDYAATPRLHAEDSARRGRKPRAPSGALQDVVSANCSPTLRAAPSPGVGGIAKLRMQLEPLSLDGGGSSSSSRANSASRSDSRHRVISPLATPSRHGAGRGRSPNGHAYGSGDETSSQGSTSYEVNLETDFVSESVRDRGSCEGDTMRADAVEGGVARSRQKMAAEDFEPLRCLGKGTYGTVILVKQRSTGRLYAQKQFKKASLVVHKKLIEQTKTERQILESVNRHPFVVNLFYAFQDQEKLYLILQYGQGGELFTHLDAEKMFAEPVAAFYMGEMLLALSHLHDHLGVIYRDLKPENCLLDAEGHLLLTDFGLSKVAADGAACSSMLGTVEYMAPEVIQGHKYGKAVDWWSFGALGYDLMTGNPPFRGGNHAKIQENIVKQKLAMPYFLSPDAKDLLTRLLRKDPAKRLGSQMPRDLLTMKKHRFFRKIDWRRLEARELEPPIQPMITDPALAENFSPEFTELSLSPVVTSREPWGSAAPKGGAADGAKEDPFGGFSFVASSSLLESGAFPPYVEA